MAQFSFERPVTESILVHLELVIQPFNLNEKSGFEPPVNDLRIDVWINYMHFLHQCFDWVFLLVDIITMELAKSVLPAL